MRYTEEEYRAFLEELMQRIFAEHSKISVASERWRTSFTVLHPDFGQKKAPLIAQRQRRRQDRKIFRNKLLRLRRSMKAIHRRLEAKALYGNKREQQDTQDRHLLNLRLRRSIRCRSLSKRSLLSMGWSPISLNGQAEKTVASTRSVIEETVLIFPFRALT